MIMDEPMRKFVSVRYNGTLRELGNIQGPILNPVWMDLSDIYKLIKNKRDVYEHAITDPTKCVLLTISDYNDFNIYPGNIGLVDLAVAKNTFILSDIDDDNTGTASALTTGNLYVEILD
jgi:hypothetical protein